MSININGNGNQVRIYQYFGRANGGVSNARAAAAKCREYLKKIARKSGAMKPLLVLGTDSEPENDSDSDDL
jgi:hypothetical protein